MDMNISSLIKVFGIAAAGFVPRAQANPFGISFVKVDPPKDKKEEAICFRLKLSQTDVFSEHNFTDITFRHNTTVESLKKPFKNFNAEKDPFEIPEKYLPLEDKDRAERVDKDGKPLKFLVAVVMFEQYDFADGTAQLCISGYPKWHIFSITDKVRFLDGVDCIADKVSLNKCVSIRMEKLGLKPKQSICCMFSRGEIQSGIDASCCPAWALFRLVGTENYEAFHAVSDSYWKGSFKTGMRSPFFTSGSEHLCGMGQCVSFTRNRPFTGDCVAVVVWKAKVEIWPGHEKYHAGLSFRVSGGYHGKGFLVEKIGEVSILCKVFRNIIGRDILCECYTEREDGGEVGSDCKRCGEINYVAFLFPKNQPNK